MVTYHPSITAVPDTPATVKGADEPFAQGGPLPRCASAQRHQRRARAATPGLLDAASPVIAARLRDEGVPAADTRAVAQQLRRLLPILATSGSDVLSVELHPWVHELIARYQDKAVAIFLATRGKVEAR